jgi:hypothetical protein
MHISGIKKHTLESAHKRKESKEFEKRIDLFIYLFEKKLQIQFNPKCWKIIMKIIGVAMGSLVFFFPFFSPIL